MNKRLKGIIKHIVPCFIIESAKYIRHYLRQKISQKSIKYLLKRRNTIYLEIGAGSRKGKNEWITVDLSTNCDIYWDLKRGLPFPDESIHKIYSSHVFEHFTFKEGQKLLDECLRVMVPGCTFSICVPNARLYISAYLSAEYLDPDKFLGHKLAYNNTSKIDYINYIAYMGGEHRYMFDEGNIVAILKKKGFKNVCLRDFDPNMDIKERDFQSIYAEAKK